MVRIERNVSIVDYVSIDDPDLSYLMREYAVLMETNNGSYFQFDGFLEHLDEQLIEAADDPSDYARIVAQINSLNLFMTINSLKETDYFYFWW